MKTLLEEAIWEIEGEDRLKKIEQIKTRMRKKKWWHTLFPYTIKIIIQKRRKPWEI